MIREWLFVVLAKMNWLDIHQIPVQNAALGVRLENGNYPTLRLFFVQCSVDCA